MAQALVMPTIMPIFISPGEKPKQFIGLHFTRWPHKMLFYLTTLNISRFLTKNVPKLKEDKNDIQDISVVDS